MISRRGAAALLFVTTSFALLHFAACGSTTVVAPSSTTPDSGTPDVALAPCVVACQAAAEACAGVDPEACNTACASRSVAGRVDASVPRDVLACLKAAAADCAAVTDCFRPPPATPFDEGPYGTKPKDTAGPFTLATADGATWDFKREWTGQDSYVFLFFAPSEVVYPSGDYGDGLYKGNLATELLAKSPANVHYFFMPLRATSAWGAAKARWAAMVPAAWAARVHFVDTPAIEHKNWIGDMMKARRSLTDRQYDSVSFAIDRFQKIREVGMLGQLTGNGIAPKLGFLAYEPAFYEFEWNRDRAMRAAAPPTVVTLATQKIVHDTFEVDVTLPDADKMATFDTLEADLTMDCPDHRDATCGAWDYLSHMWVCDPATHPDGGAATWKCTTEIARWITAYWREGRWVTDISGMLPFLKKGGPTHLKWHASGQWDPRRTDYTVSLSLRLSNRQKGMRPVEAVPLWNGGSWNAGYDAAHPARQVTVPAGTKKVDLYTLITGHGGSSNGNCAEFCNHEHKFTINGKPHLRSFPGAQAALGCANEGKGVVPNQHGTWYFGRGGWCPGHDVAPWIVDVTSEAKIGQSNDLGYTTAFGGSPVTVDRGNIVMSSYLVFWQ